WCDVLHTYVFFFQAEDGIRDRNVTGVQTCALPIFYIYGNGRSGLVGRMIAMRLMHSGYGVYVIGETTTPAFEENDLLIILSGSGKGHSIMTMTEKARSLGGKTALVTAADDAVLRETFDAVLSI